MIKHILAMTALFVLGNLAVFMGLTMQDVIAHSPHTPVDWVGNLGATVLTLVGALVAFVCPMLLDKVYRAGHND